MMKLVIKSSLSNITLYEPQANIYLMLYFLKLSFTENFGFCILVHFYGIFYKVFLLFCIVTSCFPAPSNFIHRNVQHIKCALYSNFSIILLQEQTIEKEEVCFHYL
jgi:hypothetical protein